MDGRVLPLSGTGRTPSAARRVKAVVLAGVTLAALLTAVISGAVWKLEQRTVAPRRALAIVALVVLMATVAALYARAGWRLASHPPGSITVFADHLVLDDSALLREPVAIRRADIERLGHAHTRDGIEPNAASAFFAVIPQQPTVRIDLKRPHVLPARATPSALFMKVTPARGRRVTPPSPEVPVSTVLLPPPEPEPLLEWWGVPLEL